MKRLLSLILCAVLMFGTVAIGDPPKARAEASKLIAFTFDDGPSYLTPTLLDGLDELDAKVTFFLNGENGGYCGFANQPDIALRAVREGHQLANHTYAHRVPFDELSASAIRSEVERVNTLLYQAVGGQYQTLVRTPGGALSSTIRQQVDSPIILWSVDTFDWKYKDATTVYSNIIKNAKDGSVILLHDLYESSIQGALNAMRVLKAKGYELVTVSELYRRRGVSLKNGEVYSGATGTGIDLPAYRAPVISVADARVTISSPDSGLTFYYTTDGSVPTLASKRYTGPVDISYDTVLTVVGYDAFATRTPITSRRIEMPYAAVFNAEYYSSRYEDVRQLSGEESLLSHFLETGLAEGRQAAPAFSINYYMTHYADLRRAFGDDRMAYVRHFLNNGRREGRQACENFDPKSYRLQYADVRRAYGDDWSQYYRHFNLCGASEGRVGTGCERMLEFATVYGGVDYAAVYSYNYYTAKYPEVFATYGYNDDAVLRHFVTVGMEEGRIARVSFDVKSYYRKYPDLRRSYGQNLMNYYRHYANCGQNEGRLSRGCVALVEPTTVYDDVDYAAVYNYEYYTQKYPDVLKAYGENDAAVLKHFVSAGMREGRQGNAEFSAKCYAQRYPDLKKAFGDASEKYYLHFIKRGKQEGRRGTA